MSWLDMVNLEALLIHMIMIHQFLLLQMEMETNQMKNKMEDSLVD